MTARQLQGILRQVERGTEALDTIAGSMNRGTTLELLRSGKLPRLLRHVEKGSAAIVRLASTPGSALPLHEVDHALLVQVLHDVLAAWTPDETGASKMRQMLQLLKCTLNQQFPSTLPPATTVLM